MRDIAGKLDRRITIRRYSAEINEFGEAIEAWRDLPPVSAEQVVIRADERFAAMQTTGIRSLTFRIRYRADLTAADRVSFEGREYNILGVREVGRRVMTEFDMVARED